MVHIEQARNYLLAREEQKKRHYLELHAQAKKEAEQVISLIIERFQPQEVWQWGSILEPRLFRDYSDIDIAVSGLPSRLDIFEIYKQAEPLCSFPLHLVEIESIWPQYVAIIKMKGKRIYPE